MRTTDAEVIEEIDRRIDTYTDGEIANLFNERGVPTVVSTPWTGGLRVQRFDGHRVE